MNGRRVKLLKKEFVGGKGRFSELDTFRQAKKLHQKLRKRGKA